MLIKKAYRFNKQVNAAKQFSRTVKGNLFFVIISIMGCYWLSIAKTFKEQSELLCIVMKH